MPDYLENPLDLIRKGALGPSMSPEAAYGSLREAMAGARTQGAGYLSGATRAAGYVPQGLSARVSAITEGAGLKAATQLAGQVSQWEAQRYNTALDRWWKYYGLQQQQQAQRSNWLGSLFGGIAGIGMNLIGLGAESRRENRYLDILEG